ncbi:efflux RND transporter permease subunit [Megasphaera sp.]|uniref:efflux RND transporter permease subunit n=1 Tax=Megasphaera sp. TaxID=2023260 RepID=UPI002581168F|nr:efflux RND transporter permease subunit [Megasphaera sp.]
MSSFFIRRPIFAIVISIIIVILGALSLLSLPIAQYPQISPPTVNLSTTYTGANATIVNQTVAQVIEDQLKGVDDMSYMASTSSNDGSYSLSVVFSLDSDGNTDAINVQNDANLAKNSLPSDVQTQGLTVRRSSGDMVLMANLYSPNGTYNQAFLKNYADIYLLDKIQRIDGVGNVNTFGSSYAMRVWLNPEKLAERGLTVSDVVSAIKEQNMSAPAGTIGSLPAPATQEKQYSAKVEGQLTTPEQFGNIILKSASNGQFVYLKDVANIQTGTQNESSNSKINGKTGIGFGIQLSSDAKALDTITEVKKVLDQAKETFPPDLDYTIVMDNTNFINASINEVKETFVESLILVILVVFVFLQKWRTTLIPVLAVPVSIVGTFASFKVLDFTINTLTLFAMVLAIGLVVDDAIVVIENVEEHMSKDKQSAKDATEAAMKEVQGPIIATTAVLASIFIPVAFIGGVTGVLYKQFAVTITISVVISAFVALTLTPALCGVLLKPSDKAIQGGPLGAFFRGFNRAFDHFKDRYTGKVSWMIHHLKYAAVFLILVTGLMGICYRVLPSTFVPDEDQGVFMASITMPEGTSLNQTIKTVDAAAEETRQIPGVKDVMTHAGGSTSNTGNLYVALENWDDRQSNDLSAESIIAKFNKTVVPNHPEARVAAFNPSSLPGMGQEGGWTMQLMDNTGLSDTELGNAANQVVAACSQRPELSGVRTSYATNTPSVAYTVDREKIKNLGIELSDVFTALQTNFGGSSVNDFTQFGRSYKVIVQADTSYRSQADSLKFISVKSSSGKMVPLDTLLTSSMTTGPSSITRFNLIRQKSSTS